MTDKELLELAAKAAGIQLIGLDAYQNVFPNGKEWDPLTDDGDAFRLAVKLNLIVCSYGNFASVMEPYDNEKSIDAGRKCVCQHHGSCSDKLYSTRRAIVLLAAEIGKAMK